MIFIVQLLGYDIVMQYVVNNMFQRFNQGIAAIIKPPVEDVVQFLKEHIQHDIRCIARSTGNNNDEAVQIIHLVLAGIVKNLGQQGGTFSHIGL
jgi:hypothetical protein